MASFKTYVKVNRIEMGMQYALYAQNISQWSAQQQTLAVWQYAYETIDDTYRPHCV